MDTESPSDDPYDSPYIQNRIRVHEEHDRLHRASIEATLSELHGDLHDALKLALACIEQYEWIADHDLNRDSMSVRPYHREKILGAAAAIWDQNGWHLDELRNDQVPFAPDLLREVAECRRSGPGSFRPANVVWWQSPHYTFERDDEKEFPSAFWLLDSLMRAAHSVICASSPPCSGSLVAGWSSPTGIGDRRPDSRCSGGECRLDLLDFNFLLGRRAVLPILERIAFEDELMREARALSVARRSGPGWFALRPTNDKHAAAAHEDGTAPPDIFWHAGRPHSISRPMVWRLIDSLWVAPHRSLAYDELPEKVWLDREHEVDDATLGSLRRDANKFFRQHEIPFAVAVKNRFCTLRSE